MLTRGHGEEGKRRLGIKEKPCSEGVSRIDSALSGATESLDMFSPGGLFDAEIPEEKTHSETTSMFNTNVEESSSYSQEKNIL